MDRNNLLAILLIGIIIISYSLWMGTSEEPKNTKEFTEKVDSLEKNKPVKAEPVSHERDR